LGFTGKLVQGYVPASKKYEEIEQRDAQLNGFFVNAPVGLAIIGNDLRFQRINGPFSKLNGLLPEVNTGLHVRDVTSNLATALEPLIGQVKCDFYEDRALCRDLRRKLELWLDPAALHTFWNRTWRRF
jgi:hypothetical protein